MSEGVYGKEVISVPLGMRVDSKHHDVGFLALSGRWATRVQQGSIKRHLTNAKKVLLDELAITRQLALHYLLAIST